MLEGRKGGLWSERYADGTVALGAYTVAGRHGQWFLELANGASATVFFVSNGRDPRKHQMTTATKDWTRALGALLGCSSLSQIV